MVGRTFSAFSELWLGEAPMAEGLSPLVSLNDKKLSKYQYFVDFLNDILNYYQILPPALSHNS